MQKRLKYVLDFTLIRIYRVFSLMLVLFYLIDFKICNTISGSCIYAIGMPVIRSLLVGNLYENSLLV